MPINSRSKGLRFERKMAKEFSKATGRDIVRVPASGGLEIRSDLYDPYDPNFDLFIECKSGYNFNIGSFTGKNDYMTKILDKEVKLLKEVNFSRIEKQLKPQNLVIVFTSKVFSVPFVVFKHSFVDGIRISNCVFGMVFQSQDNVYLVMQLKDFLEVYKQVEV